MRMIGQWVGARHTIFKNSGNIHILGLVRPAAIVPSCHFSIDGSLGEALRKSSERVAWNRRPSQRAALNRIGYDKRAPWPSRRRKNGYPVSSSIGSA